MPIYEVKERRAYTETYIIKAKNKEAAGRLDGEILDEWNEGDDYGLELISVKVEKTETEGP